MISEEPLDKINVSSDDNLVEYIDELEKIDETKLIAKINEISIIDRNGGRIYF